MSWWFTSQNECEFFIAWGHTNSVLHLVCYQVQVSIALHDDFCPWEFVSLLWQLFLPFPQLHLSVQSMVPNVHNVQYIAFSWIILTLVQDFSSVYPLLVTSSNRIELCYNETRFQPIKYSTLLKVQHNASVERLRNLPEFELFMQCDGFHYQIYIYHSEFFVTPLPSSSKLSGATK